MMLETTNQAIFDNVQASMGLMIYAKNSSRTQYHKDQEHIRALEASLAEAHTQSAAHLKEGAG